MKNGEAASFQDNSAHGEDSFLVRELGDTSVLDAVMDGVSQCEGAYASGFTQQMLQDSKIQNLDDMKDVLEQVNSLLFQSGQGNNLLTTISAALKLDDQLHLIFAGDSPVYLITGGELQELTTIVKSRLLPSLSGGAVGQSETFKYQYKQVTLQPGDRLILTTDGLIDNVFPEEMAEIVRASGSPEEAVSALEELVGEKRRQRTGREDAYGTFREDDQTAIFRYFN